MIITISKVYFFNLEESNTVYTLPYHLNKYDKFLSHRCLLYGVKKT